ncbi:surface lipoprotein assembly modifier [Yoonia sp. 2307UL14-13]|uniref:surface lipoprotein assembly modifier n=1 Tax=Yoonia sp. 2307UL14-13 TaxID=3126506 RepID=UPI0030ACACB3
MKAIKALTLVLGLLAQPVLAQTTVDVPLGEARVIARQALLAGDTELALQITQALLEANPDDRIALIILAAGAPRVGQAAEGRRAGARAFALSRTDEQRYEAARLTALAATNEERFTLATFWLRRALNNAPNPEERARTLQDARVVTQRNPWSTNLSFSVVPSNNVNGGAEQNEVDDLGNFVGNLSADSLALAGVRATLGFGTSYRFFENERNRASVAFQYQLSRVQLEDETQPVPGNESETVRVDSGEFSTDYYQAALRYQRAFSNGIGGAEIAAGSFDFGGEPYYDFRRISFNRSLRASDRTTLALSAQREWQDFESEGLGKGARNTYRTTLSYRLDSGDRISGTLGYVTSNGDASSQTFEEWKLEYGYAFSDLIGPAAVSLNAGIRVAEYPDPNPPFWTDTRNDKGVFYRINLGFPNIEYAGFSPGLTISGGRDESNVGRFTRNNFSVGLTINSAF